ncbi:CBO0543 family protein [Niallia oryzisoli]|uniref:CBO0543 family protein n=1 Tax=Niallia oryzisoli TaxID=1737571 RepID=A0ABZ2C7X2_9BACI
MASYQKEKNIIISIYILNALLLFKFVPKDKIRHATVIFLFKQVITWFFGLLVVEKKLIEYPYRPFFKKTYKASFCFEYFFYPVLSILFNLYYPEKRNALIKTLYQFIHASMITALEVLILKYSKLIRYKNWKWYWSFMTIWFSNYLSHRFYKWFIKENGTQGQAPWHRAGNLEPPEVT